MSLTGNHTGPSTQEIRFLHYSRLTRRHADKASSDATLFIKSLPAIYPSLPWPPVMLCRAYRA